MSSPARENETVPSQSLHGVVIGHAMKGIRYGRIELTLPDGKRLTFAGSEAGPMAALTLGSWRPLWRIATGWDIGFAEAYMNGEWSSPDLPTLLKVLDANSHMGGVLQAFRPTRIVERLRHLSNRNTRLGSRRNIAAHYDLGNAFYAKWLDPDLIYSSAIYPTAETSLEAAQSEKIARICELLSLSREDNVLEIGCGWGGLGRAIAERHRCCVTGITLSSSQLEYARTRAAEQDLRDLCTFHHLDYRDLNGQYDRIASIEMIEAVGESFWPEYFAALHDRLKPGGIALLQAITIAEDRFAAYRAGADFIQRYIFPGGMLPTPSLIERHAKAAGLELNHVEFFGESYTRTLVEWRARFLMAWPQIERLGFDLRFKRMWDYYLAYCQAGFETGALTVGLYRMTRPGGT